MMLFGDRLLTADDDLGLADDLGFADNEGRLGVLQDARDGRERVVGRVDL